MVEHVLAAGTGHRLHDDGWVVRQEPIEVARKQLRVLMIGPTNTVTDDDAEALVLEADLCGGRRHQRQAQRHRCEQ